MLDSLIYCHRPSSNIIIITSRVLITRYSGSLPYYHTYRYSCTYLQLNSSLCPDTYDETYRLNSPQSTPIDILTEFYSASSSISNLIHVVYFFLPEKVLRQGRAPLSTACTFHSALANLAVSTMRLRQRPSPLFLLLIPSFTLTYGFNAEQVADLAEGRDVGPLGPDAGPSPSMPTTLSVKSNLDSSSGIKDAPVDGKDGRPHAGPFVETNAERGRKKAKENGDDDAAAPKRPLTDMTKGAHMPETNDGVMDDPNRTGPKEGTRGTEGGISEKNRDKKAQEADIVGPKPEKIPDPPKEAPPLPHSEQEIVEQTGTKDSGKKGVEEEERPKELGGLEVFPNGFGVIISALILNRKYTETR